MKYLVLAVAFLAVSCTKNPVCDIAKTTAGVLATEVGKALDCSDQAAIKQTLEDQLVKIKVCKAPDENAAMSPIGDFVCEPLVSGVIEAASGQIPATWKCSGGVAKDQVKAKLLELCQNTL